MPEFIYLLFILRMKETRRETEKILKILSAVCRTQKRSGFIHTNGFSRIRKKADHLSL